MLLDGESSVSFFPSSLLILICWTARASISMLLLLLMLLPAAIHAGGREENKPHDQRVAAATIAVAAVALKIAVGRFMSGKVQSCSNKLNWSQTNLQVPSIL